MEMADAKGNQNILVFIAGFGGQRLQYQPGQCERKWIGHIETGQASYYADRHVDRHTASGELYKAGERTAAHRTLPFGSMVRVTNIKSGKRVVVRINDRGPFVRGRIIDLSRVAFESIGRASEGLLQVQIEVIR